jgi:putative hydrolase of the HAD superfamily
MRIEGVLFDAAETLFTTRGSVGEIYGRVARDFGCTATPEEIQIAFARQFRHSGPLTKHGEKAWWRDVVRRVFGEVGMIRDFNRFFEQVYDQFRDSRGWMLFPETRNVLSDLKGRGLRLGIISNFDSRLYTVLRDLDILSFFDAITISSETGYAKPDPEIFSAACRRLDLAPDRILLVGDSLRDDVLAALGAGLHAVLIDREGRHTSADVPKIRSLREIEAKSHLDGFHLNA